MHVLKNILIVLVYYYYFYYSFRYVFPKQCLTSQFWTLQQKSDFAVADLKRKLKHYRPVFRHLQAKVISVKDENLKTRCQDAFYKVFTFIYLLLSVLCIIANYFLLPLKEIYISYCISF